MGILGNTILLAAVCFAPSRLLAAAASQPTEANSNRDIRMVRDVSRFHFEQILEPGNGPWIVGRITPDDPAYSEEPALNMTEDGGQLPGNPSIQTRIIRGAAVEVLAALTEPPAHASRLEEVTTAARLVFGPFFITSESLYSPFHEPAGGVVVCRINDRYPGVSRFAPAILIPSSWQTKALPAFEFIRGSPGLWASTAAEDRKKLLKLLDDDNPFLAVAACRSLAAAGGSGDDILHAIARGGDPIRQGAFVRRVLEKKNPRAANDLAAVVDKAVSFEAIRGIALGTLATLVDLPETTSSPDGAALFASLKRKARDSALSESDRHLSLMIEGTGGRRTSDTR